MAFNAKTFDLTGRWPLVEIWLKANSALTSDATKTFYVTENSEDKAKGLMHTFNRVRRALHEQKGGDAGEVGLDHIILKVVQLDKQSGGVYAVSFSDRSEPLQKFKLQDKQGNII